VDEEAPTVTHTVPEGNLVSGTTFNFTVTATDNVSVDRVFLFLQEPGQISPQTIPMVRVPGTDNWTYSWVVTKEQGFAKYYFEAWDEAGNIGREPGTAAAMHQVLVENEEREAFGALILVVAFLLVFLPVMFLIVRARKREEAAAAEEEAEAEEAAEAADTTDRAPKEREES
jgi:cbb3-type cytochrome oxidase subunit 3